MLEAITPDRLEKVWPEVVVWVVKACETSNGRYMAADVKRLIANKSFQLWRAKDGESIGVCVTEIIDYPHKRYCRIVIGTGTGRDQWQGYIKEIEAWARSRGCHGMESIAREGWWRAFFKFLGWKKTHIYIERAF